MSAQYILSILILGSAIIWISQLVWLYRQSKRIGQDPVARVSGAAIFFVFAAPVAVAAPRVVDWMAALWRWAFRRDRRESVSSGGRKPAPDLTGGDGTGQLTGERSAFFRWGSFVAAHSKLVLGTSTLLLFTALPFIPAGIDKLSPEGWVHDQSETVRGQEMVAERFSVTGPTIWLVFENEAGPITDNAALAEVAAVLEPVREHPHVVRVTDYLTTSGDQFISTDGRKTYASIELHPDANGEAVLVELRESVPSGALAKYWGGDIAANLAFNETVKRDLLVQEAVSLPLTLILLVIIFGTLVAASLPISIGLVAIGTSIGGIAILALLTDTSIYVLHVATMIGLALAIDYSLFIVSRFREEMARRPIDEAVAVTMGTAGKAVFFAGLTVAIGLVGLSFFPMYALRTMGLGGGIVVTAAIFYTLTILPSLLAILGHRVDGGRVRNVTPMPASSRGFWHWISYFVMRRPLIILVTVLILLVAVGSPFLRANFAPPGIDTLPASANSRIAFEMLLEGFPQRQASPPIIIVVDTGQRPTLEPATFEEVRALYQQISESPGVIRVESIFDFLPSGEQAGVDEVAIALQSEDQTMQAQMSRFIADTGARFNVTSEWRSAAPESASLVRSIRDLGSRQDGSLEVLVTGGAAFNIDMMDGIRSTLPYALGFIFLVTYVVLFLLLGSVLLPLKAIVVNLLSITAAFGALVWIFQEGNLSGPLAFDATGYIVPTIAVIMFCVLFGLSMDYEVMMLSRMKEEYERTGNNTTAVAIGLERTGRVITGAASIMIVLFGAGITNHLVMLKSLGIGMAVAIFVDATIVRALLVPSTMRLMGTVNWWAPAPLKRFQEWIGIGEVMLEGRRDTAIDHPLKPLVRAGRADVHSVPFPFDSQVRSNKRSSAPRS
jgi:putative drug exporter of the RND superfamily